MRTVSFGVQDKKHCIRRPEYRQIFQYQGRQETSPAFFTLSIVLLRLLRQASVKFALQRSWSFTGNAPTTLPCSKLNTIKRFLCPRCSDPSFAALIESVLQRRLDQTVLLALAPGLAAAGQNDHRHQSSVGWRVRRHALMSGHSQDFSLACCLLSWPCVLIAWMSSSEMKPAMAWRRVVDRVQDSCDPVKAQWSLACSMLRHECRQP